MNLNKFTHREVAASWIRILEMDQPIILQSVKPKFSALNFLMSRCYRDGVEVGEVSPLEGGFFTEIT